MKLSEHRGVFSQHVALTIIWAALEGANRQQVWHLAMGEVKRTEYQQAEYVRKGASRTMLSDHLEGLAVDFELYIDGAPIILLPTEVAVAMMRPVATHFVALDPEHNYWGLARWGFDVPHMGRRKGGFSAPGQAVTA